MIGAGWTALFGILQALDPVYEVLPTDDGGTIQYPIWPISADESKKLGAATAGQIATLPAARRRSLAKFLNEYAPGMILAATLYEVAGPRARFSLDAKKAARVERTMAAQRANPRDSGPPGKHEGNGAARPPGNTPGGVSAPPRSGADPSGAGPVANAYRNGVADAFTTDPGLG